jgi:two-component system response regulator PhoP
MRALVIEDEDALRQQVVDALSGLGFAIDAASDGSEGLYLAQEMPADIAIVDLGLPGRDGLEIIREVRKQGRDYPILILTARTKWQDKVEGLEAGADDYLAKPFHMEELLARVRALVRRSGGWSQTQLECGPLTLDTRTQAVALNGSAIDLTAYEYKVLEYLMLHAGKVISKSDLIEHIYAEDSDRDSNTLEVFVRRLRKKLDPNDELQPIETLRGRGYRLQLERGKSAQ